MKVSAIDLIKSNFDFVQKQYCSDFEKQDLIGYDEVIKLVDQFVGKKQMAEQDKNKNKFEPIFNPNQETNYPLIITGDKGTGKTHAIIKWLCKFNLKDKKEFKLKNTDGNTEEINVDLNSTKELIQTKKVFNPNVNENEDVVISYFAGIDRIGSSVTLESLVPLAAQIPKENPIKKQKKKDTEPNKYQTFIYNVMIKIRSIYNLDQRIDILDDHLRTQFFQWLELASKRHIENKDKKTQIILILDGPENFTDETGQEQSADWIPVTFPQRFKVIIVVKQASKALQLFIQRKYPIIFLNGLHKENNFKELCYSQNLDYENETAFVQQIHKFLIFDRSVPNFQFVQHQDWINKRDESMKILKRKSQFQFNPTYLTSLILFKDILYAIKDSKNLYDLFEGIILNYYQKKSFIQRQVFLQILIYLTNARKGLVLSELEELLVEVDHFEKQLVKQELEEFTEIFDFAYTFSPVNEQLMSQNFSFVQAVSFLIKTINEKRRRGEEQREIEQNQNGWNQINQQVTYGQEQICLNLVRLVEKQHFSLRQIDELAFQYQRSKNFQKLKDLISSIEVFSILYNTETKHQLAQYWQWLEYYQFDPVSEYNRSLENFVTRYSPNNDEIFIILLQLSRFLLELADFETKSTPHFQHPSLQGNVELDQITLLTELIRLGDDIYKDNEGKKIKKSELKNFMASANLQNPIQREQFKKVILQSLNDNEQLSQVPSTENQAKIEHVQLNYYYKRWLWVQFPWWCINIFQNVSKIMELSINISSLRPELVEKMTLEQKMAYDRCFTLQEENELVMKTLNILKEAKLRKQGDLKTKKKDSNETSSLGISYLPPEMQNLQKKKEAGSLLTTLQGRILKQNSQKVNKIIEQQEERFGQSTIMQQKKQLEQSELNSVQKITQDSIRKNLEILFDKGMDKVTEVSQRNLKIQTTTPNKTINQKNKLIDIKNQQKPPLQFNSKTQQIKKTYAFSLKEEVQSQKAQYLKMASQSVNQLKKLKPGQINEIFIEDDENYLKNDNKLFLDVRRQIFTRNKSVDATKPQNSQSIHQEKAGLQKILNDQTSPKVVLQRLKDKYEDEQRIKIIQIQNQNLKLNQNLNSRIFEIKKLKEELRNMKQKEIQDQLEMNNHNKLYQLKQCEILEAQILTKHNQINITEIERVRMLQILEVTRKNPSSQPDFIINLESTINNIKNLIVYERQFNEEQNKESELFNKEINLIIDQINKKLKQKDALFDQVENYIEKVAQSTNIDQEDIKKIRLQLTQMMERKKEEIKEELDQKIKNIFTKSVFLKKNERTKLNINEDFQDQIKHQSREQVNALNEVQKSKSPSKTGKSKLLIQLQDRLKHFSKWKIKLQVSVAFLAFKQDNMKQQLDKIQDLTDAKDITDLQGLVTTLEQTQLLKQKRLVKLGQMQYKQEFMIKLKDKIKNLQDQVQQQKESFKHIDQFNQLQAILSEKKLKLQQIKFLNQNQVQSVAQVKTGLQNILNKTRQFHGFFPNQSTEINEMRNAEQINAVVQNLKKLLQGLKQIDTPKKLKQEMSTSDTVYKDFVLMMPLNKQIKAMEKERLKRIKEKQSNDPIYDIIQLKKEMNQIQQNEYQNKLEIKRSQNKYELAEKKKQQQIKDQIKKEKLNRILQKNKAGLESGRQADVPDLPHFKKGEDITPLIAMIRQQAKSHQDKLNNRKSIISSLKDDILQGQGSQFEVYVSQQPSILPNSLKIKTQVPTKENREEEVQELNSSEKSVDSEQEELKRLSALRKMIKKKK